MHGEDLRTVRPSIHVRRLATNMRLSDFLMGILPDVTAAHLLLSDLVDARFPPLRERAASA
jgi:hypothetical protein